MTSCYNTSSREKTLQNVYCKPLQKHNSKILQASGRGLKAPELCWTAKRPWCLGVLPELSDSLANIGPTCLVVKYRECEDVLIDFTSEQKLSDDIGRPHQMSDLYWFVKIIPLLKWSTLATLQDSQKKHANIANHFPCHLLWQLGSKAGC